MRRNLFKQMKNEWRDNIWLIIELTVVCMSIWAIAAILCAYTQELFSPRGFNPDNVFSLTLKTVPKESADYIDLKNSEEYFGDLLTLIERIRNNRNVEAVAVNRNGLPYNYNFSGGRVFLFDETDSTGYLGNMRNVSPEYIKVMGIKSKTGATEEQLIEMLRKGELLISESRYNGGFNEKDIYSLKGKRVIFPGDSSNVMRVGDIIEDIRRTDYESSLGTIIVPMNDSELWGNPVILIRPGQEKEFMEDFRKDSSLRKLRNTYLTDLQSLVDIRESCQRSIDVDIRLYAVMIGFLLITIFLGLLGTFWFRLQQRVSEIAIRKVSGAKKSQIFRRIISEGMILLGIAAVIVSLIIWPLILTDFEMLNIGLEKHVILIVELITLGIMALGIIVSLWWPAKKAMLLEPAIAIKDE